MDNIELMVKMPIVKEPEIIYPLGWDKDGQAKRRERRKSAKKDKSRWHIKQNKQTNTTMAKEIKYRTDGVVCQDKCPHTGCMIGSGTCFCCEWYDHQAKEQPFKVYCNHP